MNIAKVIATGVPVTRYQLKARVIETGHDTFTKFAESVRISPVYLSQILNGYSFPSPALQSRMAEKLGLTLRELRELL